MPNIRNPFKTPKSGTHDPTSPTGEDLKDKVSVIELNEKKGALISLPNAENMLEGKILQGSQTPESSRNEALNDFLRTGGGELKATIKIRVGDEAHDVGLFEGVDQNWAVVIEDVDDNSVKLGAAAQIDDTGSLSIGRHPESGGLAITNNVEFSRNHVRVGALTEGRVVVSDTSTNHGVEVASTAAMYTMSE